MAFVYTNADYLIKKQQLNLETAGVLKAMLVDNTYVANQDDVNVSAASSAEIATTGYVGGFGGSGRKVLTGVVFAIDNANNRVTLFANNPTWASLATGETVHAMILIHENTTDADSVLVAYLDGVSDYVTNGDGLTVQLSNGFPFTTTT